MTPDDLAVKQAAWLLRSHPDEDDVGLRVRTQVEGRHKTFPKDAYAYEGTISKLIMRPSVGYDYMCERSPRSERFWAEAHKSGPSTAISPAGSFYANKKNLVLSDWEDD